MMSLPASPNIISLPLPPVRLSIPEPPVKVYNPAADAETLIVLPVEPEVKFAVPSFRVLLVAVNFLYQLHLQSHQSLQLKHHFLHRPVPPRSATASVPESTLKVSLPALPVRLSFPAPPVITSLPVPPTIISTSLPPLIMSFQYRL